MRRGVNKKIGGFFFLEKQNNGTFPNNNIHDLSSSCHHRRSKTAAAAKLAKRSPSACDIFLDHTVTRSCWTSCKCSLCLILIRLTLAGELALGLMREHEDSFISTKQGRRLIILAVRKIPTAH